MRAPAHETAVRLDADSYSVREVTVEIPADQLIIRAQDHDVIILRVVGLSSESGRPVSKSIRIPTAMLKAADWDYRP